MIDPEFIKRFTDWRSRWTSPKPMGLFDYISFNTHPEDVIILGNLFFPKFTEIKGCIFLDINLDRESYFRDKSILINREAEKAYNHVYIYELFGHSENVKKETFVKVGELLKASWSIHLKKEFPDRKIIVELIIDDKNYGPILSVYQE